MTFLPGDRVRHQFDGIGTLTRQHNNDCWWAIDENDRRWHWYGEQITLVERPYPGTFDHVMTDVVIDERVAPIWGWVFLLVAVVALCLVAWFGIYLAGLL